MSDDEDDLDMPIGQSRNRANLKARTSDEDLRAMMDVDDCMCALTPTSTWLSPWSPTAEVVRVSKSVKSKPAAAPSPPPASQTETEERVEEADVPDVMNEDSDDPAPKTKPRKRKEKKVIPVGRNGLKKKRVVKSKTDFDDKGYMGEFICFSRPMRSITEYITFL